MVKFYQNVWVISVVFNSEALTINMVHSRALMTAGNVETTHLCCFKKFTIEVFKLISEFVCMKIIYMITIVSNFITFLIQKCSEDCDTKLNRCNQDCSPFDTLCRTVCAPRAMCCHHNIPTPRTPTSVPHTVGTSV